MLKTCGKKTKEPFAKIAWATQKFLNALVNFLLLPLFKSLRKSLQVFKGTTGQPDGPNSTRKRICFYVNSVGKLKVLNNPKNINTPILVVLNTITIIVLWFDDIDTFYKLRRKPERKNPV